jgi:endonuclease/exonuclease/phosphatase family metal-dependent hydrolase
VRLATFNLLNGTSLKDGQVVASRLHDAVGLLDADVVGLQEVDRGQGRSHRLDLTAEVARAAGVLDAGREHWRFVPALVGTPGGEWRAADDPDDDASDAHYGIGLVSRWPVSASPVLLPGTRRVLWLQDEPRVGLVAVVQTPHGPVTVGTTHLSFVPLWNGKQLRTLTAAMQQLPGPHVLLGDLNMPGGFPRWLTGWRSLAQTPTYPAWDPKMQLDHVLGTGDLPPVLAVETPELPLSDHRALLVELGGR